MRLVKILEHLLNKINIQSTRNKKQIKYKLAKHNYKKMTPKEKGSMLEKNVSEILNALPNDDYCTIKNILLQDLDTNKTTQIDHIILSKYGIFVIETKNYSGYIYGNEKGKMWTQVLNKNSKYRFNNPLHQNYGHIKFLEKITGTPEDKFISLVVFADSTNITNIKDSQNVVNTGNLYKKIMSVTDIKIKTIDELYDIKSKILLANINSKDNEKTHIDKIVLEKYIKTTYEENYLCPICKSKLIEKNGKYGKFLGCSNFPKCRFTKNIDK